MSARALCSTFKLLLTSLGRCLKIFICHTFDCLQIITRQISRDHHPEHDFYYICDCFELFLTSLGRSRKITIQNVALNSTNTAEMQINWKASLHCIIVGGRQRKEHLVLQGVPNSVSKRFIICSKMWMNLWQWFGPYVHQGSKGREMGHKLQRSCRKSYERGQGLHCCAELKGFVF